ncbi:MAG: hypothetical protein KHX22_10645, partial [Clostridiales bacterium]|nr:hypothetical protein [Clostridiales bacterium]
GFSYSISLTSYMLFLIHLTVISLYAVYFSKFIRRLFCDSLPIISRPPSLVNTFFADNFFLLFLPDIVICSSSIYHIHRIYPAFVFLRRKNFFSPEKKFFSAFAARIERNVRLAKIC